jgi:hypothetical protein
MESPPDKPTRCAACRGTLTGDERACPHCGIRILCDDGTRDGTPFPPDHPDGFDNLPPGLAAPRPVHGGVVVPEGTGPAPEPPEMSAKPEPTEEEPDVAWPMPFRWSHGLVIVALIVVYLAAVHLPRWISSHLPEEPDPLEILEARFRSYLDSDALKPPAAAPPIDLEALTAEMRDRHPHHFDKISASHRPLTRESGQSLHDFFETYLKRLYVLDPTWALELGLLPHPKTITPVDPEADIRWFLVDRDTWRILESWPDRDGLSAHDRIDYTLLRSHVETWLRWRPGTKDHDYIMEMLRWFDSLEYLATFDCCANREHFILVEAHLKEIAGRLNDMPDHLQCPPRESLKYAIAYMRRIRTYLDGLARQSESHAIDIWPAVEMVAGSMKSFVLRLQKEVLPRAKGAYGAGPANYDAILRVQQQYAGDAVDILRDAIEEFASARKALRKAQRNLPYTEGRTVQTAPLLESHVKHLSRRLDRWTSPVPRTDPGVRILKAPPLWYEEDVEVFFCFSPPPFSRASPSFLMYQQSRTDDSCHDGREILLHTAAHESYPGHHLQATLARESACRLRQTLESALLVEGWAVYAEDLIHEAGACSCRADLRASDRLGRAFHAIMDVLIHTRAADTDDVIKMMCLYQNELDIPVADVVQAYAYPIQAASYFIGHREIRRIRRNEEKRLGPDFRLREFHGRLLRCGPLPPALLEEALKAQ